MGSEQPGDPTRLVLVRHGESVATVRRRIGGPRTCEGLSPLGRAQAERLAGRLTETTEIRADLLASSAFPRAVETAGFLEPVFGHSTSIIDGLGEHDPGPQCDGLSYDEFLQRHGMPDWESDPYSITFPGGETIAEFHHRVWTTVRALIEQHRGGTLVAVCHGGVIDAVLRGALRCSPTGIFEMHTTNASLTELLWLGPGRWRLIRYNDAAHLVGLDRQTPRLEAAKGST
jgi:probable phosphoglycerate mutase